MKRWRRKVMIAAAVMLAGSLPQAATAEESQTAETEEVSSMVTVQQLGLEDGTYIADGTLEGGSGRATISSPVELTVKDGQMTARIEFSSPYYDYMIVDGEKYEPENTEGNSQFTIPMAGFDAGVPVTADTVAMSEPHEIDYEIVLDSATLKSWDGQTKESEAVTEADTTVPDETTENTDGVKSTGTGLEHEILEIPGLTYDHSMELEYATQFAVDYYQDDYAVITIAQEGSYLVVPEGKEAPEGLDKEIKVLQQPLDHIYLVATSSMDLFRAIGGIENITLSGTDANGWYIEEAKEAIEEVHNLIRTSEVPMFGICMGHQILALALGGKTYKLKYGHRGGNHGVYDKETKRSYITSQNHGYAVQHESIILKGMEVTHLNLNDGTVEGMEHRDLPIFSVQFHPEASPGPDDNAYLFDKFINRMKGDRENA